MTAWRKSSYSDASGNNCVEVAQLPGLVGIRDSKHPEAGHLAVTASVFGKLVRRIQAGGV